MLLELGALATKAARTILGAAVIDDILAMVLLAVAVGVADQGGVDATSIAVVVAAAAAFVAFVALGGTRVVARWPDIFHAPKFSESPSVPLSSRCSRHASTSSASFCSRSAGRLWPATP